jgi:hypothetical protein
MSNQEHINALGLEICDLVDKYKEHLPVYEVVNQFICNAVSMSLYCAPNELVGIKTIMACIEHGINEYEQNHS